MIIIKKYISKYKYQLFCLIVAFSMLLFTSKNSFLYTFNDWCDANAFFTVGKSIIHGLVPYKDIFEQNVKTLRLSMPHSNEEFVNTKKEVGLQKEKIEEEELQIDDEKYKAKFNLYLN